MTWFRVDDGFHDHPKFWNATEYAVCLWVRAGSWSAEKLTDGFIPDGMIHRWTRNADVAAQELVTNGTWKRVEGGFQFHDWNDWNPSKEKVLKEREQWAERQRRSRERAKSHGVTNGVRSRSDKTRESHRESHRPDPESPNGDSQARARVPTGTPARPTGVEREVAKTAAEKNLPMIRELLAKKRGSSPNAD